MIVLQMQIRMNVNTSKGSTSLADSHSNSYIPVLSSLSLPLFLNPQILKKKKKKSSQLLSPWLFTQTIYSCCYLLSATIKRCLLLGRKAMTNLDSILKSRDITLPTQVRLVKTMVFPVVTCGCASLTIKNWCFWTLVLEKTLESPLDIKEIKPVNPKGNQSWIFFGRTDAEAPILWLPDVKSWLTGKDRCWERLKAGGEGNNRGWDGWMVSLTRWTWVWASSRNWWWTGKPGVLQSMGSQRVWHDWGTELTDLLPPHQPKVLLFSQPQSTHQDVFLNTVKLIQYGHVIYSLFASPNHLSVSLGFPCHLAYNFILPVRGTNKLKGEGEMVRVFILPLTLCQAEG